MNHKKSKYNHLTSLMSFTYRRINRRKVELTELYTAKQWIIELNPKTGTGEIYENPFTTEQKGGK